MNDFNDLINSGKPTLVDFFATWCGPCKMQSPILEQVKNRVGDEANVVKLVTEMFEFIRDYKGEVPGASPKDCGNYLDMNLGMANYLADRYLKNTLYGIDEKHLTYPE